LDTALTTWPDDLTALEGKGNAFWLQNRLQAAAEVYDTVLVRDPNRETTLDLAGTLAIRTKRYDAAIGYWKRAIQINPWRWRYHFLLAESYTRKSDWTDALASCQKALALNPNSIETRFLLVTCYLGLGDLERAQHEFDVLMKYQPPEANKMRRWFEEKTRDKRR
jgi:tetratricopeptide (TPR) repeat protein